MFDGTLLVVFRRWEGFHQESSLDSGLRGFMGVLAMSANWGLAPLLVVPEDPASPQW